MFKQFGYYIKNETVMFDF